MKKLMIVLMAAAGVLAVGCGEKGGSGSGSGEAAAGGDKIGIQACDDYITKMEACLGKMDPAAKAATETSFKQTRDAWKAAAAQGGAAKDALKQGCEAAVAAIPPNCK
jgi:hypothetical protein